MARKKVAQMREDYSQQLEREEEERRLKDMERQARIHMEKKRCENPTTKVCLSETFKYSILLV
jgi:hypothetical protein